MAEGQSRYGIMEQLNNRKLNEKEKLVNLEQERRNEQTVVKGKILGLRNNLVALKSNYKENHAAWKMNKLFEKERFEAELKEKIESIDGEIAKKDNELESTHKKIIESYEKEIQDTENSFQEWLLNKEAKIKSKQETISDIDKTIKDLKEMSKEQSSGE